MRAWCLVAALGSTCACAEDDPFAFLFNTIPSSLTVAGGGDNAGSRDMAVDADLTLPSGSRVSLGVSRSEVTTTTSRNQTNTAHIGVRGDPLNSWSRGVSFALTRDGDGMDSATVRGSLRWRPPHWTLVLSPEWKRITVPHLNTGRDEVVRSPGLGAAVTFRGWEHWSASANYAVYAYSTPSGKISTYGAARVSETFDANRAGLAAGYAFAWGELRASWDHAESALDHAGYDTSALEATWDVHRALNVFARVGGGSSQGTATHRSAAVGATYFWE